MMTRSFTNITDAQALIGEIGVQAYDRATHWWWQIDGYQTVFPYLPIWNKHYEGYNWYGLMTRDVLAPAYPMPVGGAAMVQYLITIPKS